jgi:ribosome biogenesis GTPase / thiamine phosphate phosphatase
MTAELPESQSAQASGDPALIGTVLAIQANYYQVQLDSPPPHLPTSPPPHLLCTRRSRLKKLGQRIMVGDRVMVQEPDWAGGRGAIAQVLPRRSELDRPPVANADFLLLVFALMEPTLDPVQLSRFLVKAESTNLEVLLCLSKSDLAMPETQESWRNRLQKWGYTPLFISVRQGLGLGELEARLGQNMTIVSGPSGVGKSSLINRLIPQAQLRVGEVSGKLARGRHTTRHVELFELPQGGLLADTPGFNQPELDCSPRELAGYFPEARDRLSQAGCQFSDCSHRDEPNCGVRGNWERYNYYLRFLEEAIVRQQGLDRLSNPENTQKLKSKRQGKQQYEPKLETKRYRRSSRHTQQQSFQGLEQDDE